MYCEAVLNFINGEEFAAIPQSISDGRVADLTLWDSGIQLMQHGSAVNDWHDPDEIQSVHYDEVRLLAKRLTGCDWVLFYPAIVRSPRRAAESEDFNPIQFAHSDYTEAYFDMIRNPNHPYHKLAIDHGGIEERISSQDLSAITRVLTLQLWRNVGDASVDFPLCFCDTRTVDRSQLMPVPVDEYGGLRTEFESFALMPPRNSEYEWYTFPMLQADEVVVFRAFDSKRAAEGQPFWTPHTAFADPIPVNPSSRQSIEMRAICLFK